MFLFVHVSIALKNLSVNRKHTLDGVFQVESAMFYHFATCLFILAETVAGLGIVKVLYSAVYSFWLV